MQVARFNPDGSLDASFGNAGRAVIPFCPAADCQGGEAVALDTAHRILIAGYAHDPVVTPESEGFAVATSSSPTARSMRPSEPPAR